MESGARGGACGQGLMSRSLRGGTCGVELGAGPSTGQGLGAAGGWLEADEGCCGHAGAYDWFQQTLGSLKGVTQGCDGVKCVLLKTPCGFSVNNGWEEIERLGGVTDKALVLEKTLESPLDCKEIQSVHPKGNQS